MEEKAYAKINLYLHVTGKRDDGYHLLDSLVVFPDVGDLLTIKPAENFQKDLVTLQITGPFSASLQNEDFTNNLIIKAVSKLTPYINQNLSPIKLCLEKNLPVSSGIGGGSSDAAATLRLLIKYWDIKISQQDLSKIALQLGADVPVCLNPVSQRMEGIGEKLSLSSKLPDFGIILVNHGEAVSTADIFRNRQDSFSSRAELQGDLSDFNIFIQQLANLTNDLQPPACSLNPKIITVLQAIEKLPFCRLSRMSGSGATCFGLFETKEQAKDAAVLLTEQYPWWVWGGNGKVK